VGVLFAQGAAAVSINEYFGAELEGAFGVSSDDTINTLTISGVYKFGGPRSARRLSPLKSARHSGARIF